MPAATVRACVRADRVQVRSKRMSPCMRAGQPLLFDHRTHRGPSNSAPIGG